MSCVIRRCVTVRQTGTPPATSCAGVPAAASVGDCPACRELSRRRRRHASTPRALRKYSPRKGRRQLKSSGFMEICVKEDREGGGGYPPFLQLKKFF